jgi:hypothetical protein
MITTRTVARAIDISGCDQRSAEASSDGGGLPLKLRDSYLFSDTKDIAKLICPD